MSNDNQSPNVETNETNVQNNLSTQSGYPNMSNEKTFLVQNGLEVQGDAVVSGTVTATSFIGDGSQLTGISGGGGDGGLDSAGVQSVFDNQQSIRLGEGATTQNTSGEVAIGYLADATGADAIAIGYDANATALFTLSLGRGSNATYEDAIAIGRSATSSQADTIAMGTSSVASGSRSVAIGNATDATGTGAVAIGNTAQALAGYAISIGSTADTNANSYGIAIGSATEVTGTQGIAIGQTAEASQASVAIGSNASVTTGTESTAIGPFAGATGNASLALGRGAKANANNTIALAATGANSTVATQFGIDIRTSAAGSLTYSTDSDWVFGAPVTSSEFKFSDGTSMTTAPTGGGSGGLDSAAIEAMIDSDLVGAESPNSYTMKIGANASRIAIGSGAVAERVNSMSIGTNAGRYITGGSANVVIGSEAGGAAYGGGGTATRIVAIGENASTDLSSLQSETIAIGYNAGRTNMGHYAVAIGSGASISNAGQMSIGLGYKAKSSGYAAIAIGSGGFSGAKATGTNSIAIGEDANATTQYGIDIRTSAAGSLTYDTTNDWTFGAGVTMTDLVASGATVVFNNLPTVDPVNAGQLWNDAGTMKISAG